MPADLREFTDLKHRVESLQKRADRAQGAFDQLTSQLKKEYGVTTLDEGKRLLLKLEKEEQKAEREYREALEKFLEEWGDQL
jgi:predicted Zn-dependent protease